MRFDVGYPIFRPAGLTDIHYLLVPEFGHHWMHLAFKWKDVNFVTYYGWLLNVEIESIAEPFQNESDGTFKTFLIYKYLKPKSMNLIERTEFFIEKGLLL